MEIKYKNKNLQKTCTNASAAEKKHGTEMAYKIKQRINEISAAESVEQMIRFRIGRCHQLKGDRKNQYAVDLVQPHRLVFEKRGDIIEIAYIVEIVDDYH